MGYGELLQVLLGQQEHTFEQSPAPSPSNLTPTHVLNELLVQLDRLTTLLDDLLDVSRLDTDAFALTSRGTWNLMDLVSRVARQQAVGTGRVITVEADSRPLMGTWDEVRLEQVLNNLVSNALKFSPAETSVTLIVQGEPTPKATGQVLIKVRDQGRGIAQEHLAHIFDRFYHARNPGAGNSDGLGLGLYIAAEIVKRHGGKIWVESLPGVGSTFERGVRSIYPAIPGCIPGKTSQLVRDNSPLKSRTTRPHQKAASLPVPHPSLADSAPRDRAV